MHPINSHPRPSACICGSSALELLCTIAILVLLAALIALTVARAQSHARERIETIRRMANRRIVIVTLNPEDYDTHTARIQASQFIDAYIADPDPITQP